MIHAQSVFHETIHEYNVVMINLICLKFKLMDKNQQGIEHSKFIWLNKRHLMSLKWVPADIPAVNKLINE